ncbi:MAG: hypothetical protein ACOZIN_00200 [Myxococcota bacterium]
MSDNRAELLRRLQDDSPGAPLERLCELIVEDALGRSVEELLPFPEVARIVREALSGWLASERALPALEAALSNVAEALTADRRTLAQVLPSEGIDAAAKLLARPYSPDRGVVLALLQPEPVRALVRELALNIVLDFGRRLGAPLADSRVAKGLGGLAKFAAEQAKSRTGSLGAIASGMVGAVSEEMERQLDKRAAEFVDAALSGILQRIAEELSNPSRAANQAALRVAMLEGVLGLTVEQLGHELQRLDVPGGARIVREAATKWLSREESQATLEAAVETLLGRAAKRTPGEMLDQHGLLASARAFGKEALQRRLSAFVQSPAFADWLADLLR